MQPCRCIICEFLLLHYHLYHTRIHERIQTRRKQLGYTQERLAEEMNVSIQMVSNLERGNKAIRIDNLMQRSSILAISTDYILMGAEPWGSDGTLAARAAQLSERDRRVVERLVSFCLEEPV